MWFDPSLPLHSSHWTNLFFFLYIFFHPFLFSLLSAEHGESFDDGARNSADPDRFPSSNKKSDDIERIEDLEDSDSDNGEFITIKVTNSEGQTEEKELDLIKEHNKPRYAVKAL